MYIHIIHFIVVPCSIAMNGCFFLRMMFSFKPHEIPAKFKVLPVWVDFQHDFAMEVSTNSH